MSNDTKHPQEPQSPQRMYRVVIEQTMFTTVMIEAASQDEAEERACEHYTEQTFGLWDVSYGQFSVNECALMPSDVDFASCAAEQVQP